MNGHPIDENTPFYQRLDEETPRPTFDKKDPQGYHIAFTNPYPYVFHPSELEDYSH